ncbi:MAG: sugar kinase [Tenericutes bacterium]|nr:sugar kinase [Mycoplasmatota bacterium]
MSKIVTFGEVMLRLSTDNYRKIQQSDIFRASYAGSELNVAVSLANFGEQTYFVTKLPKNILGDTVISVLNRFNVNSKFIKYDNNRLGTYYVERGASQRPTKVIYDRKFSSIALAKSLDFNWEQIFKGADWFHFSGITPALSDELTEICFQACVKAKEMGVKISCDLNYRSKLWSKDKASEVMKRFMPYINILIANEEDAKVIFNYEYSDQSSIDMKSYEYIIREVFNRNSFDKVFFTLRESLNSTINGWSSISCDKQGISRSKKYDIYIVDRLGGGDSFAAGIIYSELKSYCTKDQLEFATAASCLKHTINDDFNLSSVEDVKNLLESDGNARIKR